jgi:class 3 adenylate cyclase/tetratricopeptide (TPR) repeat protein
MNCPSCKHPNTEDARFCEECGAKLERACAACGAGNAGAAKFCRQCGESLAPEPAGAGGDRDPRSYTPKHLADKILQSKSALEGERKQVTVLFADIKGSMDMQETIDAEDWHRIMNRFFEILADGIHRFEGTVNQYTGDGVMALFGAPIAHEDHAHRACYAALSLSEELRRYANELRRGRGFNFSVRMGINSGEVIVGKIGDDLRMDYTAQGHTVGLAARMEQLAEPGKAYLTEHTAGLVSGYFDLEDLGEFELQGSSEAVHVHDLRGVGAMRTRLDVSRSRGLSKFVGRRDEMASLEAAVQRAIEGNAQVVGVVGEAGVGKSRLCSEFLERCRSKGLTTFETSGVSHGKAVPFLPMLRLFRAFFGIRDEDSDATSREKIAGRLLLLDETFREALPLLFDFMGVPDPAQPPPTTDPEARQSQLLACVRGVLEARGKTETTVTLVEDLHWFDGGSELLLAHLVEAMAASRALVVLNFRPEYAASWMQKSYYQRLPVVPLGADAIVDLLHHLLGEDSSVRPLFDLVRDRTGGNPFFVEEVVQSLAESGSLEGPKGSYRLVNLVGELSVPQTVEAVIAARIDRLQERDKRGLQTAAVIGRKFPESTLRSVIEFPEPELAAALSELQALEFVYAESLYPDAEYAFKHPLTQDVAYRSQLSERRALVHGAVARTLEEGPSDRIDEHAALIAHHWERAGEALKAAHWHKRAGQWVGTGDIAESLRHWRHVRELLRETPETQETIDLGAEACGQILMVAARAATPLDDLDALLEEGRDLARRSSDPRGQVFFLFGVGGHRVFQGLVGEAVEPYQEAERLAEGLDDDPLKIATKNYLGVTKVISGDLEGALVLNEEMLPLLEADSRVGYEHVGYEPRPVTLVYRALMLSLLGRVREAEPYLSRGMEEARSSTDPVVHGLAPMWAAWAKDLRGDAKGALAYARQALEGSVRVGASSLIGGCYFVLARALLANGQYGEAVDAVDGAARTGLGLSRLLSRPCRPLALLGFGDAERARAAAEEAVAEAIRSGARLVEGDARLAMATVAVRTSDRAPAEAELAGIERLVAETGYRVLLGSIHELRAELAAAEGNSAAPERELREAHRLFSEMGATGHAKRIARKLEG